MWRSILGRRHNEVQIAAGMYMPEPERTAGGARKRS